MRLVVCLILSIVAANAEENYFTVSGIHNLIGEQQWSCLDVVRMFLQRSEKFNSKIKAIISFNQNALKEAKVLDQYFKVHNKMFIGKLHCIPILVKDNVDVKDIASTAGVNALNNSIPRKDALVVSRLRKEGAIVIGKANMAEFGNGKSYDTETGGMCRNPWDLTRSCGISSTGSGAGISSGLAVIGIGVDTEGSIIEPSCFNGLFGLRPFHEVKQLEGLVPGLERLDTIGPMAKKLDDVILAYSIMADNAPLYENYKTNAIEGSVLRVGVLNTFMNDFDVEQLGLKYVLDKQVKAGVAMAIENMKKSNIEIVDIDFDLNEFSNIGLLVFRIIAGKPQCGEACFKQTWNSYLGDSERFDTSAPYHSYEEFLNKSTLSAFWREYFERGNIDGMCQSSCADFDSARMDFAATVKSWYNRFNVDTIIYPSISNLPFEIKPEIGFTNFDDLSATFFSPYTGFSALNVPIGFSKRIDKAPDGLPMGLTMLTPTKSFAKAILIAKKFETEFLNGKYPTLPRGFA